MSGVSFRCQSSLSGRCHTLGNESSMMQQLLEGGMQHGNRSNANLDGCCCLHHRQSAPHLMPQHSIPLHTATSHLPTTLAQ